MITGTDEELLARGADLSGRAAGGELTYTHFLTPREQRLLKERFGKDTLALGGYAEAERRRVYFLPPYLSDLEEPYRTELLQEQLAESLVAVLVIGSGFRALSHRDFLGAVLHLGIERDRIGDVAVISEREAVLFCDPLIAAFLTAHLERVANDAVSVRPFTPPPDFDGGKRYLRVSDTVASPRLDAVVAALANLSRQRAQELLRAGKVELDYEVEERCDAQVCDGAVLVIRGVGKFTVRTLSDKTRKGRFRLLADKHI